MLESVQNATPVEKTLRKRLNATPVEKTAKGSVECDPCRGNATQVPKYEICRRILSVRRCDLCGQTMVPVDEIAPEYSECEPSRIN